MPVMRLDMREHMFYCSSQSSLRDSGGESPVGVFSQLFNMPFCPVGPVQNPKSPGDGMVAEKCSGRETREFPGRDQGPSRPLTLTLETRSGWPPAHSGEGWRRLGDRPRLVRDDAGVHLAHP